MKAIFLDRDNTLIVNSGDLGDPRKVRLCPKVSESLWRLRQAGYVLIVVTNQGGVARGKYSERDVDAVHQQIAEMIDNEAGVQGIIDRFYYCPYHPDGSVKEYKREHPWRKPQPGMLVQAARDLSLNLKNCWMVGDSPRDIVAGKRGGTRTVRILVNSKAALDQPAEARADFTVNSIEEAVDMILDEKIEVQPMPVAATVKSKLTDSTNNSQVSEVRPSTDGLADTPLPPTQMMSAADVGPLEPLRRSIQELTDEVRAERLRRSEFTPLRMVAGLCQLGVIAMVVIGILRIELFDDFIRWMISGVLLQLLTLTIITLDSR